MTVNLHITVKQAARLINVSERMIYDARRLTRTGRDDLVTQVKAGEMSIHRALILAGVKAPKAKMQICTLKAAWQSSTQTEQLAFINWLEGKAL